MTLKTPLEQAISRMTDGRANDETMTLRVSELWSLLDADWLVPVPADAAGDSEGPRWRGPCGCWHVCPERAPELGGPTEELIATGDSEGPGLDVEECHPGCDICRTLNDARRYHHDEHARLRDDRAGS